MNAPHTHAPAELGELEASTGLHLVGYLAVGSPFALVPVLSGRRLSLEARRELVARLNGRGVPIVAERPQVEQQGRRGA
jgi:hypothetical protein